MGEREGEGVVEVDDGRREVGRGGDGADWCAWRIGSRGVEEEEEESRREAGGVVCGRSGRGEGTGEDGRSCSLQHTSAGCSTVVSTKQCREDGRVKQCLRFRKARTDVEFARDEPY